MKKYLVLFLFYSCLANATLQNPILNKKQQRLNNGQEQMLNNEQQQTLNTASTQTNSIVNIENNLNTTTTMLKESTNESSFTQNNQNQLDSNTTNSNQTQSTQTQLNNNQLINNINQQTLTNQNIQQTNQEYQLSTHILDINKGQPAPNVRIALYKTVSNQWVKISDGTTDNNGRIKNFLPMNIDNSGTYKLSFFVKEYFENQGLKSIYPYVEVVFDIEGNGHYHIPITISANGYSTYRGN